MIGHAHWPSHGLWLSRSRALLLTIAVAALPAHAIGSSDTLARGQADGSAALVPKPSACPGDPKREVKVRVATTEGPRSRPLWIDRRYFGTPELPATDTPLPLIVLDVYVPSFGPWESDVAPRKERTNRLSYAVLGAHPLSKGLVSAVRLKYRYEKSEAASFEERPMSYDLIEIVAPGRPVSSTWPFDIFIHRDGSGEITDSFRCHTKGDLCDHLIVAREVTIDMSYARPLLPEWRSISRKARRLLECITSSSS